jgi:hypothetical protein
VKLGTLLLCFLAVSCKSSPTQTAPLFEDVARQTGIDFWQYSGATGEYLLPEMVGSGGALIDYDNDGDMDVFLVQGYPTDPQGKPLVPLPAGWKPGNRLFRNNLNPGGKLTFTDVTEAAGLSHADKGMGVAAGDYDNDGYTDLYVTNYDHNILYHNNGNGTFTDVTAIAGVASSGWSTAPRLSTTIGMATLTSPWFTTCSSIHGLVIRRRGPKITAGLRHLKVPPRSSIETWGTDGSKT